MARSTFYYHIKKEKDKDKYQTHKKIIYDIYHTHKGRYGYRRICLECKRREMKINHKTVFKLMGQLGLKGKIRVRKYNSYKGEEGKIAPNLLNRDFSAKSVNQKWATDICEFKVGKTKVYLSCLIDLFNREIISYTLSDSPSFKLVMDMINKGLGKFSKSQLTGLILHSDQGWHYQMHAYRRRLKKRGILQSMSRKATPLDNAVIENFFGTVKSELFYLENFSSQEELETKIKEYIKYYNNKRIKIGFKGMTPVQFRKFSLSLKQY